MTHFKITMPNGNVYISNTFNAPELAAEKKAHTMTHTATDKRNALNATTKKEQALASRIAALPQDSDEAQELLDSVTNIWVIDLVDILRAEQEAS